MGLRAGGLAMLVKSEWGNEGKIIRCGSHLGVQPYTHRDGIIREHDSWEIFPPLVVNGIKVSRSPSYYLFPLDPEEDHEVLQLRETIKPT